MNPQGDKIKGNYNSVVGKVKETAGQIIDDKNLEARGTAQHVEGKEQHLQGVIKENIQKGTHVLGDAIEKVGKKFQEKGYAKVGTQIEKMGDKLEHLAD